MPRKTQRIRIITLLLCVIFLAEQFHTCADLTLGLYGSPICSLCSSEGSVDVPQCPRLAILPATNRIEVLAVAVSVSPNVPRSISPRAPPTC